MKNRETFNKLILFSVIGVLSLGNLMLLYYRINYWCSWYLNKIKPINFIINKIIIRI